MEKPKIGLALGSGGARGFAHLGILKVLNDHHIPVDYIAGSSMGALVAALYAAGQSVEDLYRLSIAFRKKFFLDLTVPKQGSIIGNRIKDFIRLFTYNKNIEQLNIPTAIVATDLKTGQKVVFKDGPVSDAVRASISIPGIFVPVTYRGRLLVDGGVVDRVPVSVVREMGADIIIASDVSTFKENNEISSIFDVILQSLDIMQAELMESRKLNPDILLTPNVSMYSSRAFTNIEEIIKAGEEEAKRNVNKLIELIANWKGQAM